MKKGTDMFDFIKRLFVRKRTYLTSLKPCPCCGGKHIRFKAIRGFLNIHRIICDDCGFTMENIYSESLLADWEKIPRNKEDKS